MKNTPCTVISYICMATYLRISNVNHDLPWSEVSMLVVKWSPTHFISLYAVVKLKIIVGTNPMRDRRYESGSGKKLFELFWALTIRHQESKPIVSNTVVCYVVLLYTISDHEGSGEQGECSAREPYWQWKESCLTVCLSCLAEADAWYVVAIVYHECIVL